MVLAAVVKVISIVVLALGFQQAAPDLGRRTTHSLNLNLLCLPTPMAAPVPDTTATNPLLFQPPPTLERP
jgi:hypothetical protein